VNLKIEMTNGDTNEGKIFFDGVEQKSVKSMTLHKIEPNKQITVSVEMYVDDLSVEVDKLEFQTPKESYKDNPFLPDDLKEKLAGEKMDWDVKTE
jgi:hypothetical protein